MTKNREGFKICPRCKIEYPRTHEYFSTYSPEPGVIKYSGHCRKCTRNDVKRIEETKIKDAYCRCCNANFTYSNNKSVGYFCSKECSQNYKNVDRYLSSKGLIDLSKG